MTDASDEKDDIAIVLTTAGKAVRLGSVAKWRRAIVLRDLRRDSVVVLELGGRVVGRMPAQEVEALTPLFDELGEPAPAIQPADEDKPLSEVQPELSAAITEALPVAAVQPAQAEASSTAKPARIAPAAPPIPPAPVRVTVAPGAQMKAPSGGPTAVSPTRPATGRPKKKSSWPSIIVGLLVVFGLLRACSLMGSHITSAPQPPYPITNFVSPVHRYVASPGLNMHTGPGVSFDKVGGEPLTHGADLVAFGQARAPDGGTWVYVRTSDGVTGYVNARLLSNMP